MKRIGHIIDRITLDDIRREAESTLSTRRFRRPAARKFLDNFDTAAGELLREIKEGTWTPDPVEPMHIVERGKVRYIEIPSFRDFIVQRVLLFGRTEKHILNNTWSHAFSSIKGRGPLKAAKHVARLIKSGKGKWCLYFDVRKYYEHINREIVCADLATIIKDPIALELFRRVVYMGEKGIAIGNTASHLFANLYLTPVAEALRARRGVTDVVTYMDNVFVFGTSKRTLHAVRRAAVGILAARGLSMKKDWQVFRTDCRAVHIGGFRIARGRPWRIYRQTFKHAMFAVRAFIKSPTPRHARSLAALRGWLVSANCRNVYNNKVARVWAKARKVLKNEAKQKVRRRNRSA